jgi:prophage tail gpP-like protein
MGPEIVTVSAGGSNFVSFKTFELTAAFKDAARSFHLVIAAEAGPLATAWALGAGVPVSISLSGDLAFTGYVDRYKPSIEEHKKADIAVSGRSKAQDFIDSSAVHATGQWKNKTPVDIAQDLDKFGVGISTDQQLDQVPVYRLTPGESGYRVLEKLCRSQGVWACGQADGSILVTVAGGGRNAPLIEGINIIKGEADHNWANRHSDVIVRGQRPVGHGSDNLEIEQTAQDSDVTRYRPVIVVQDDDTDKTRAGKRARHRRDSEAGNALKASVTVQGFHDDGGQLWTPGFLTYTESAFLGIAQDMAIETVKYSQSRTEGSRAHLSLVDPQALGGKGRKGGSANPAWGTDAGESDPTSLDPALNN